MASGAAAAVAYQTGAFVLQIDKVVRVAAGVVEQRNLGQRRDRGAISPDGLIVDDAAEQIAGHGDGVAGQAGRVASGVACSALRDGAVVTIARGNPGSYEVDIRCG